MFGAFSQNFVLLPFIHVHNWATHNWATQLHNWATHIHNWATHNWATQWHNWAIGWDFISVFVVIKPNYFQLTNFEYHRNSISKFFCWSDYQDFTRNWPFLDLFLGPFSDHSQAISDHSRTILGSFSDCSRTILGLSLDLFGPFMPIFGPKPKKQGYLRHAASFCFV